MRLDCGENYRFCLMSPKRSRHVIDREQARRDYQRAFRLRSRHVGKVRLELWVLPEARSAAARFAVAAGRPRGDILEKLLALRDRDARAEPGFDVDAYADAATRRQPRGRSRPGNHAGRVRMELWVERPALRALRSLAALDGLDHGELAGKLLLEAAKASAEYLPASVPARHHGRYRPSYRLS